MTLHPGESATAPFAVVYTGSPTIGGGCPTANVPFLVVTPSDPGQYYTVTAIPNPTFAVWDTCMTEVLSTTYTLSYPPVPPPCPSDYPLGGGMGIGSGPVPGHHDILVDVRCPISSPSPTPSATPTPSPGPAVLEESLQTTAYPSDAPSYAFDDMSAAGGPDVMGPATGIASAGRRTRQYVGTSGCWGTITINVQANGTALNTVPAQYDLQCRFNPSVEPGFQPEIHDIFILTDVFAFNNQASSIAHHEHRVRCNSQLCSGALNVAIPHAARIVEFEAYFTGRGAVQPESNHVHLRVPFNSLGFAYPEKVDTRYSALPLPRPTLVPFPPGQPTGPRIYRCGLDCETRLKGFKAKLERAYLNGIWSTTADQSLVGQGKRVEGHHIQELQWGGTNDIENGVLLLKPDHDEFTAWWRDA